MKKTILILLLSIATNLMAQKDTLYFKLDAVFHTNWLSSSKKDAEFYRPMPLKKVGGLYQIRDYYVGGNIQMEGFTTDQKKEIYQGKAIWYYKNGNKEKEITYQKGERNGISKTYFKDGTVKTKGTYKNDKEFHGTFESCCPYAYVDELKNGKRTAGNRYYKDSKVIAEKSINDKDEHTNKILVYNKKGEQIAEVTVKIYEQYIDGKRVRFHIDNDKNILSIEGYENYKNGKLEGECVEFDLKANQIAKGIYKDGKPYSGTFLDYSILKMYKNGKLEGEEITFEKDKIIAKGINKNGTHWSGQFKITDNTIASYKNGQLEGKQTTYYTDSFGYYLEKIKSYYHILNNKKERESGYFDEKGKQIAKGIYKNDIPFTGTFYDDYYNTLSSFKEEKKHGVFIQYDSEGKITAQQEYENDKRTGKVRSKGSFQYKICECIYKNGNPFSGQVCEQLSVVYYKKGFTVKRENYEYDYEKEETIFIGDSSYDHEGIVNAKTVVVDGKTYSLTLKSGKPNNGVSYAYYNKETITYKNGKKEGSFTNLENKNRDLIINGNYTNNLWDGLITFNETSLGKETTCIYKDGKPINGTVIENNTFTTYKKGLKQGLEKEILYDGFEQKVVKIIEFDKGIPLHETWPQQKNDQGTTVKGIYKNGKPFNGSFFDFKLLTASLSYYKDGQITGNQYVGYNHHYSLSVIDTMQYRSGKPYQGKIIEPYKDKLHFHAYNKGNRIKTIVTDAYYIDRIKNTISYTKDGFIVADEDTDLVMFRLTYLNEAKTKAKVMVYSDVDKLAGTFEFYNNKITAIDIQYTRGSYKIKYALVDADLVITIKGEEILIKSYPKLDQVEKFTYKDFLNPEILFADGEVVLHTYIDDKHIATGILKYNDMFDGVHIMHNYDNNTYLYFKYSKGKNMDSKRELTKKELLKLLQKK